MMRLLFALGLALALPVMATDPSCNPEGNQLEMNRCASDDLEQADTELNTTYRQIVAALADRPLAAERLRSAQRLWVQLRDADLAAQFPLAEGEDPRIEYGSIYPLEYAFAKAELTRQRTTYLRTQFLGPDVSGH